MTTLNDNAVELLDREDDEAIAAAKAALSTDKPFQNRHVRLSMAVARASPPPPARDYIIWDTANTGLGFGLRVYSSGAKRWIVQKKQAGKPVRTKIGIFPAMTCSRALKEAKRINAEFSQGLNPNVEKKKRIQATAEAKAREALSVGFAYQEYEKDKKEDGTVRSIADRRKAGELLESGKLWRRPLLEVTGEELHDEYRRLIARSKKGTQGGATQAGATLRWLRAAYKHATTKRRLGATSPFLLLNDLVPGWYKTKKRTNIIASHETQLATWWAAVERLRTKDKTFGEDGENRDGRMRHAGTIADYLQLSLLFGSRRCEILPLRWSEVDLENGLITFRGTKNGKDHIIPFGTYARDVLKRRLETRNNQERKSEYVFPSSRRRRDGTYFHIQQPQNTLRWVINQSGVPFSPHDLRRTFATLAEELETITTATLERLLNHAPSTVHGQHYVHQRMRRLRPLYERLENSILVEAGAKQVSTENPTLTLEAMAAYKAVHAEDDSTVTPPDSPQPKIRVSKDGNQFIASTTWLGSLIEATGETPNDAMKTLQQALIDC